MSYPGSSYSEKLDGKRLGKQTQEIRDLMLDGFWRTFNEIEAETGYPIASISAQLRHLRKKAFGKYIVNKRRRTAEGLFEYQVQPPGPELPPVQLEFQEGK